VSADSLSDRRKALEDRFFQDQESKNIAKLRGELTAKKSREELESASGIDDGPLLEALVKLDVGASDLSALALIPLVRVAWVDGTMKDGERDAILQAAANQGISNKSHSHHLLEAWLESPPKAELFEAWESYVQALLSEMDEAHGTTLKESILGLAHDVASAAGGILGIGTVSKSENEVLAAISAAFEK
jgi:hypothetical protein